MKRFLILLSLLFCGFAYAATFNQYWYNEDDTLYSQTTCSTGGDITLPTPPTKYGYDFIGWEKSYTQIEYLESTGTQWINTGVRSNQGVQYIKFIIDYYPITNDCFMAANGATQLRISHMATGIKQNAYSLYNLSTGRNENVVNNISKESGSQGNNALSLFLFSLSGYGSFCVGRLYASQIIVDGVLVRDFIPVLDPADTPCMFDKVTRQFFYNQGTGQFIAGPVVVAE